MHGRPLVARQDGIIAGLAVAERVLRRGRPNPCVSTAIGAGRSNG